MKRKWQDVKTNPTAFIYAEQKLVVVVLILSLSPTFEQKVLAIIGETAVYSIAEGIDTEMPGLVYI